MYEDQMEKLEAKVQAIKRLNQLKTEVGRLPDGNAKTQLTEELSEIASALVSERSYTRTETQPDVPKIGTKEHIIAVYYHWLSVEKPKLDKQKALKRMEIRNRWASRGGTRAD